MYVLVRKMIFNQDDVIESFIYSFEGVAAIRTLEGRHLIINSRWKSIVGDVKDKLIDEMLIDINDEIIRSHLNGCRIYDSEAIHQNRLLSQYEYFKGVRYVTLRVPVFYNKQSAILILATPLLK